MLRKIGKKFTLVLILSLLLELGWGFYVSADGPLAITNLQVNPLDKTALITWNTNQPATGRLDFGLKENYGFFLEEGTAKSTSHALTLYGLNPETTYYFKITAKTATQETSTFSQTFKTKKLVDSQAPIISKVRVPYVTGTTATVQWKTDQLADSRVYYGKTERYGSTASAGEKVTIHDLTLRGLTPATFYHFLVKSADSAGNLSTYYDLTFTTNINDWTDKAALAISDLTPIATNDHQIKDATAGISWRTNKLATGKVYFGETEKLGRAITVTGPRDFFHAITLKDLKPATRYYFKVESVDVFGKAVKSDLFNFITHSTANLDSAPAGQVLGAASPDQELQPIFYASFNSGFNADFALGDPQANATGQVALTPGQSGQAAKIESNSQIEYSGVNNFDIKAGTVAFWFKPDWSSNDNQNHILFDLNPNYKSTGDKYFMVAKVSTSDQGINNELAFGLENSNDNDYWAYLDNVEVNSGQWYFLAASWQYQGGFYKIYLNGAPTNLSFAYGGKKQNPPLTLPPKLGEHFYLGSAAIDELMIFNRMLTNEEVSQLYAAGASAFVDSGSGGLVLGAATLGYTPASALLRVQGTPDVYAVMAGQRHYISGPNSFAAYGYVWQNVKTVSQAELEKYPVARLLKTPASPLVYYLYERPQNKWLKIAIPSPTIFVSYKNNFWGDIITVTKEDIAAYPDVKLVKTEGSSTVYLIEGETIRPFLAAAAFENRGYHWAEVVEVSLEHLGAYAMGELISW